MYFKAATLKFFFCFFWGGGTHDFIPQGSSTLTVCVCACVERERKRTCVSRGSSGGGAVGVIYINNLPSAAIYITLRGSIIAVIATGQLMQK